MKCKDRWKDTESETPIWAIEPLNDVVDIQNKVPRSVCPFHDSNSVHMIVVPRHLIELVVGPTCVGIGGVA